MMSTLVQIFKIKELRNKIFFILGVLVVYRLVAAIPLPGVDFDQLQRFFDSNQLFGLLNIFSGGGLSNISIVLLGVAPYITASIIMQLMTTIVPRLEQMYKEEGEAGRQKFNMITRWLTVPFAMLQSFGMISLLRSQQVLTSVSTFDTIAIVVTATAGTVLLMWIGELITEKGIGNGISILIFAGIASGLPTMVSHAWADFDSTKLFTYIIFLAIALITVAGVIMINEAQRNIPVAYAKRVRGDRTYGGGSTTHLPLRVNQAGVIPIIFAVSLILVPGMVASFLMQSSHEKVSSIASQVNALFQNQMFYGALYFILVVLFTYFYTAVVFDPMKISENLQKQGGYVPGIRPGNSTAQYLYFIINRITLAGALFLGAIAVLPIAIQQMTGIQSLALGGTSILIVVAVVLDMVKHIESQLTMRNYDGF
ncbi:MAG: preprotein translocase subunit SecY [Candidatus Moranbacteria bacterium]|nr:preprotein translocase subunit SecY [Candidatus Moranbacteria bacterium]